MVSSPSQAASRPAPPNLNRYKETKSSLSGFELSSGIGFGASGKISYEYSEWRGRHIGSGIHYRGPGNIIYFDLYIKNGEVQEYVR